MKFRSTIERTTRSFVTAAAASCLVAGTAVAADLGSYKGLAEPDPAPARKVELSANVALTTDYVFRGQSQSDDGPAVQGGFDLTYGIFYLGVWGSSIDFDSAAAPTATGFTDVADLEVDFYGGITPKWRNVEFDFGVIYYAYPEAFDPGAELNFWELKAGWSYTVLKDVGVSTTVYYSPEYTGKVGDNWVLETSLEKPLGRGLTLSGTFGSQWGQASKGGIDYHYWNIGLAKEFHEKFTVEVRYWDTDISGCGSATVFQCDDRIVGTLSASF